LWTRVKDIWEGMLKNFHRKTNWWALSGILHHKKTSGGLILSHLFCFWASKSEKKRPQFTHLLHISFYQMKFIFEDC
jgi:hypothetical protein